MREIQASEAKAKFLQLLDDVERGDSILIRRRGKAIARLTPERGNRQQAIDDAVDDLRRLGQKAGGITTQELISMIREGRKY